MTIEEALPLIGVLVSAGVSYGMTKGVLNGLKDRVNRLEENKYLTREEYEARHTELAGLVKELARK